MLNKVQAQLLVATLPRFITIQYSAGAPVLLVDTVHGIEIDISNAHYVAEAVAALLHDVHARGRIAGLREVIGRATALLAERAPVGTHQPDAVKHVSSVR